MILFMLLSAMTSLERWCRIFVAWAKAVFFIVSNFKCSALRQTLLYSSSPPPLWKTSDLGWPKFTPKYPPPFMENFRFGMTKVYSEIPPPHFGKLQIWDDQSLLQNTPLPHFGKLQIWDDQSLLRNIPPFWKTSDLGWPKFTPKYPPPHFETSDLGWPKFTPKYPPPFGKLQIWDDQILLRNTPSPIMENFRFGMTKVYSEIPPPPHILKLQIWDDQSLLRNTPPTFWNFRFGMTKVYSEISPPPFGKLQIWDDQKLLRNTPPTKIVREFKSKIFRIPRVTTCGDFIQPG